MDGPPCYRWPRLFQGHAFHEKTPTGRKRNVLQKNTDFKIGGAQTFQVHHRPYGMLWGRPRGHPYSRTALPCAWHGRQAGLRENRKHEILGSRSTPCAIQRSQGYLSVCSALNCFKFRRNVPPRQPWARRFLQPREGLKRLQAGVAEQAHSFWECCVDLISLNLFLTGNINISTFNSTEK